MSTSAAPTTCAYCGALIAAGGGALHAEWHKANGLHAPSCLMVKLTNAVGCNCGVGVNLFLHPTGR